jgi:glycosyltransferase involved in cell wall biosynthesis
MIRSAACLIVRNEIGDIAEWLHHHHALGFDALIVYDHQSTDGTAELVATLSQRLPIILRRWSDSSTDRQNAAYRDCLARFGADFDWIAFIDADEFLISDNGERIGDLLARSQDAAAIAINWLIFGTSGRPHLDDGLVLDLLTRRAPDAFGPNRHVKSIVRPHAVTSVLNPHACDVDGMTVNATGASVLWERPGIVSAGTEIFSPWRVQHYFLRSVAHWQARLARGQLGADARHQAQFDIYDRNEILDRSALPHADRVRCALAFAHV